MLMKIIMEIPLNYLIITKMILQNENGVELT